MAKGKKYTVQKNVRVDFTPMVDMNMLLITFFMLCTTMIKSQTLQIALPSNEKVEKQDQNKVKKSEAITVILDSELNSEGFPVKDFVYYYEGMPEVTQEGDQIVSNMQEIAFLPNENGKAQGIRAVFQQRNKQVLEKINVLKESWKAKQINDSVYQARAKEIRNDSTLTRPVVIIKATPNASYASLVTALDEMQINNISRYQIDRINATDSAMMTPYLLKRLNEKKK
ncbi:MAG: ExbD/TolR family protein [Muribaculaceae bacterium]